MPANEEPNQKSRLRAALHRLSGVESSRGRPAVETLTASGKGTNINITDIDQGILKDQTYVDAESFKQRLRTKSPFRIITIYSKSTLQPLQVDATLLETIMLECDIRPEFLHIIASFGDEPHLAESSCSSVVVHGEEDEGNDTMYQIRYPEENHRHGMSNPWSLRHTGVYHRHRSQGEVFIVLQPTLTSVWHDELVLWTVDQLRDLGEHPHGLHSLLFSSFFDNWRWYLRFLGNKFSKMNDIAMVVKPESAEADAESSFRRVQDLRNINDFALFSGACCRGNLQVLETLLDETAVASANELKAEATRMRGYADSAEVLQNRMRNAIDLVGYTLTLHNQLETAKVDSELRDMTSELKKLTGDTVDLTKQMRKLTQDTVDDSITVKIITLVSAFYIPGSFVGTMFGMNFFIFDASRRRIVIADDFWIFIATWLPLTLLTVALYLFIVWLDAHVNQKEARWPWKIRRRPTSYAEDEKCVAKSDTSMS